MLIRPDSGLIFYKNTDQDCEDRKKFKTPEAVFANEGNNNTCEYFFVSLRVR